MALPAVGTVAPDFTLRSTEGRDVSLGMFRGRQHVLLAFFPLAFTSTCTAELCDFSNDYQQFAGHGAVVLPISVDSDATLKVFKAKEHLDLELLSDFKREVSRQYGTLNEERFYSNRAYVLIDRDGVVRWTWLEARSGDRRQNAELLAQLEALR